MVLPAYQCGVPPENKIDWWVFGRLALQQHMTVNTFIAARYSPRPIQYFCFQQPDEIKRLGLRSDTAYVLNRDLKGLLVGIETGGNFCRYSGSRILCSQVDGRSGVDPSIF